jgi:DNA-binding MarR family transcriptional regulator
MRIRKYLSQSPVFALYQAQGSLIEHIQDRLSKEGVHLLQGLLLTAIFFEEKEVRPMELLKEFKVSKSNLSHAMRDMEKKGFLKRTMHESDARGYLFSLSNLGRKKATGLIKIFDEVQDELEKGIGVRSVKDFVQNVTEVVLTYDSKFR